LIRAGLGVHNRSPSFTIAPNPPFDYTRSMIIAIP
jgi:hypothetical protein